jgi:RNA polymerase sigma factor (sigma-70 family)
MSATAREMTVSETRSSLPAEARSSETDADLLRQVQQGGNADALTTLMVRHGPMVFGVCRRVLGDHQHAEDAFQETFHLLFRKAGLIARPELLAGWLYGVAHRIAVRSRQRLHRSPVHETRADVEDHSAAVNPGDPDLRALLDEELQRLPEKYRVPIVLCYLEGRSNEEAAQTLGLPKGTIQSRIARGRGRLRKQLEQRGTLLSAAAVLAWLLSMKPAGAVPPHLLLGALGQSGVSAAGAATVPLFPVTNLATWFGQVLLACKPFTTALLTAIVLVGIGIAVSPSQPRTNPAPEPPRRPHPDEMVPCAPLAEAAPREEGQRPVAPREEPAEAVPAPQPQAQPEQGFLFSWTFRLSRSPKGLSVQASAQVSVQTGRASTPLADAER